MGCGSLLGDLFYLTDALLQRGPGDGWPVADDGPAALRHPPPAAGRSLLDELYRMHGEGLIGEDVFQALRALAERGQLRPADLAVHRARAPQRPAGRSDPALSQAFQSIRSRLAKLEQARVESERILAGLEARLAGLDERIEEKEDLARQTLAGDEAAARRRLGEKVELASTRDRLAAQAEVLRADMNRLRDLRVQLEARAAEMEAVAARERWNEEVLE